MNIVDAESLMREAQVKFGLNDWVFGFDFASKRFGTCNYHNKTITLSKELVLLNSEEVVKNILLHEVAHALTPKTGHGVAWVRKAVEIGCDGKRLYSNTVVASNPKGFLVCKSCGSRQPFFRKIKRKLACSDCCKKYNKGKYSAKYKLVKEVSR